jgi:hypothetical protein
MMTSMVDADSLLAVDVGSVNTRAFLFDITEGSYRFLAVGAAPTSVGGPYNDVGEGIHLAIERLQEITGRVFTSKDGRLIIPSQADGSGADMLVATVSAGPVLQTVVVGLLADVSLESANRLAASTYARVAETIGLNDRRKTEGQIDAILRIQPDIIIMAGGTEGGASRSIFKLLDVIGLACHLLPKEKRPQVIYAGNQALCDQIKSKLESITATQLTSNIRPSIAVEDLNPARDTLVKTTSQIRLQQMKGLQELYMLSGERLTTTASAFGRIIRFLSQTNSPSNKGVLGIDLGASHTTVAAGLGGKLSLSVCTPLGMGEGLSGALPHLPINEIISWLPIHISEDYVRQYIYNKPLNPGTVPATLEDLAIEQALARLVMRIAMRVSSQRFPGIGYSTTLGLTNQYEPILASGAVLTQSPTPGQVLMMLLDGLQPSGVTTFALDQNNLVPALGVVSTANAMLAVQILDSGVFLNLGTVITATSKARYGTPILRIRLVNPDGNESKHEIKQGTLTVLPVPPGQKWRVNLEPSHNTDIGMKSPGRGGSFNVYGGVLGTVIDARGRPLVLPNDDSRRRDLLKKWLWNLGG